MAMLVSERDSWADLYHRGEEYPTILKIYKSGRNSEMFRTSRTVEMLCEYAMYLESEVSRLSGVCDDMNEEIMEMLDEGTDSL